MTMSLGPTWTKTPWAGSGGCTRRTADGGGISTGPIAGGDAAQGRQVALECSSSRGRYGPFRHGTVSPGRLYRG